MKTATLEKRLEKRYTGSKSTKAYQIVKDLIEGTNKTFMIQGNIIRPFCYSGRGRFTTRLDYTNDLLKLFNLLGIKYIQDNDAPRGGRDGNFVKILTKIER
jgi:hypothetical protein